MHGHLEFDFLRDFSSSDYEEITEAEKASLDYNKVVEAGVSNPLQMIMKAIKKDDRSKKEIRKERKNQEN